MTRRKQKKYAEQLLGIGCLPIVSYIEDLLAGLTCNAAMPAPQQGQGATRRGGSSHMGGHLLTHRAMTQEFWWPQMQKDANEYVQKCEQCQRHAPMIHQPTRNLNPISSPWPFAQWGLDIIGPFPRATGNGRFILVVVDYFTK